MKKILFAALAVFALVSCSKDVATDVQKYAIDFNPSAKDAVRSTIVTTDNFDEFKVWAYHADAVTIMEDVDVTKSNGAWTYTDKKYWPATGSVDFYGLYNETWDVTATDNSYQWQFSATSTCLMFGVNMGTTAGVVDASKVPDVVYATAIDQTKDGGEVEMSFRHSMSQVTFQIQNNTTAANNISIISGDVYIDGMYCNGDYTTPSISTTELLGIGSWALTGSTVSYLFRTDGVIVSAGNTSTILRNTCMVFPQSKDDVSIRVNCQIKQNEVVIFDGVKTATTDIKWVEGKKYVYTLQFDDGHIDDLSKPIDFTASITDITSGGTSIVRPN